MTLQIRRCCSVTSRLNADFSCEQQIQPMDMLSGILFSSAIHRLFNLFVSSWAVRRVWFLCPWGLCGSFDVQHLPNAGFRGQLKEKSWLVRRHTRVPAELVKVTRCPSRLVLKSPFQVLNTTQGKNSEFSQATLGVRAKGVEGSSINPNLSTLLHGRFTPCYGWPCILDTEILPASKQFKAIIFPECGNWRAPFV